MNKIQVWLAFALIMTFLGSIMSIESCRRFHEPFSRTQSSDAPAERDEYTVQHWKGYMMLFGGYNSKDDKYFQDMRKFNLGSGNWEPVELTGTPPSKRTGHTMTQLNETFYIFGGRGEGNTLLNDLYSFNFTTNTWKSITTTGTGPSPRQGHTAIIREQALYVFGGNTSTSRVNDFYKLDLKTNEWSVVPPIGFLPSPRTGHNAVGLGPLMAVFGGECGATTPTLCNDTIFYNFTLGFWTGAIPTKGEGPSPRVGATGIFHNFTFVIIGGKGENGEALDANIYQLNLLNVTWLKKITVPQEYSSFNDKGTYPAISHDITLLLTQSANQFLYFQVDCYDYFPWWIWIIIGVAVILMVLLIIAFIVVYCIFLRIDHKNAKKSYFQMSYSKDGPPVPNAIPNEA